MKIIEMNKVYLMFAGFKLLQALSLINSNCAKTRTPQEIFGGTLSAPKVALLQLIKSADFSKCDVGISVNI